MNIDDMLCVGVTDNILRASTIGRNANKIPGEVIKALIEGNEKVIQFYNDLGISMINTGGETADVGDLVRTVIVDTTATARMKKSKVIDCDNIKPGQVIVGLASYGQASYETEYNAGMGSNGLTSARHDIFAKEYATKYPETFDPNINQDLVYAGKYKFTDTVDDMPLNMGKAVLSATRTYAPVMKEVLDNYSAAIGGIVHCSGGALTKCLHFGKNVHYIKDNNIEVAPLFRHIQATTQTSWEEMFAVFNCGQRLEIVVDEAVANDIISIAHHYKIAAQVVGRIEANDAPGNKLTINSPYGDYTY